MPVGVCVFVCVAFGELSLNEDAALRRSLFPSPAPSPTPKHASFLRVTDRSGGGASPDKLANPLREEDLGTSSKAERPDCYKHFTLRYNTSTPEQVRPLSAVFFFTSTQVLSLLLDQFEDTFARVLFLLQSAVAPPPGEEGLKLKAVIGYNGNGRGNMVWNPDTGEQQSVFIHFLLWCRSV